MLLYITNQRGFIMNKFDKLRIQLYSMYGNRYQFLEPIPDSYYNRLRYIYHQGLPLSFYLLFENISDANEVKKCLFFTKILEPKDEYKIVSANCRFFKDKHSYLEVNGKVYDINLGIIADKAYYERMFNPKNKLSSNKEAIQGYINKFGIGFDLMSNVYKVPLHILDELARVKDTYEGKHKELIIRQIESYFKDVHYEDGLLFIDTGKEKGTR